MKIINGTKKILASCLTMTFVVGSFAFSVFADSVDTISEGETVHVSLDEDENGVYSFTPSSTGYYLIYSSNLQAGDPLLYVYASIEDMESGHYLYSDDDDSETRNFELYEAFIAGETYYLSPQEYYHYAAEYDMTVELIEEINITPIAVGAIYNPFTDMILWGDGAYAYFYDEDYEDDTVNYNTLITFMSGIMEFDPELDTWTDDDGVVHPMFWTCMETDELHEHLYFEDFSSDITEDNIAIVVVSGSGTEADPFVFDIMTQEQAHEMFPDDDPTPPAPAPSGDDTPSGGDSYVSPEQLRLLSVQNFVEKLYISALGRTYDVGGRDYWVNKIINDGATGTQVVLGFIGSPEFIGKDMSDRDFVITLYSVFFNRVPSEAEIANWVTALETNTRTDVINYFASCPEWITYCQFFGISA